MAEINVQTASTSKRSSDAAFDLNLAPFLDIIVSIIPLLLLSAVFIEIRSIETPIPQVVAQAIENTKKEPQEVTVELKIDRKTGYEFVVTEKGQKTAFKVGLKEKALDVVGLKETARQIKVKYPQIFALQLFPSQEVSFDEVVKTMDGVRKLNIEETRKIAFVDPKSGASLETDLLFPNVTFGNVVGE